jgi:hypothetical protein
MKLRFFKITYPEKKRLSVSKKKPISSVLYLLHPINVVLNEVCSVPVRCCCESSEGRSRSDIVWKFDLPYNNNELQEITIAVLELKHRGTLQIAEFERAATPPAGLDSLVMNAPSNNDTDDRTFFSGNSLLLAKQAASYAISYETPYVALFDWDCMFLFKFNQKTSNYCGDFARGMFLNGEEYRMGKNGRFSSHFGRHYCAIFLMLALSRTLHKHLSGMVFG